MEYFSFMGRKNLQVLKEFKGLTTMDKYTANEGYATVAKNLDADLFPAMTVRPTVAQVGATSPSFVAVAGITRSFDAGQFRLTYGFSALEQKIYMYSYGTPPLWSSIAPTINTAFLTGFADIDYAVWNDKVYVVRIPAVGVTLSGLPTMFSLDGNASSTIAIPAHFHAIETYDNRFFGAYGNKLYVSDYGLPNDFTSPNVTDEIELGSNNDDIITALKAGNGKLTIFRRNSMYELFGNTPANFSAVEVAKDIGCVNHKSVATLEGVTYFLDKKGVYAYTGGRPRKISEVVDGYFDRVNWNLNNFAKCSVETDGKRLFVSLGDDVLLVWHSVYNVWYEWNGLNVKSMMFNANNISFLSTNGLVYEYGASNNAIAWEWVSKPFNTGALAQRLRFNRLWLTADMTTGVLVHAYISKKETGNQASDFDYVQNFNGTALTNVRIPIRTTVAPNAKVLRLKLSGVGQVTIHELIREARVLPLS